MTTQITRNNDWQFALGHRGGWVVDFEDAGRVAQVVIDSSAHGSYAIVRIDRRDVAESRTSSATWDELMRRAIAYLNDKHEFSISSAPVAPVRL